MYISLLSFRPCGFWSEVPISFPQQACWLLPTALFYFCLWECSMRWDSECELDDPHHPHLGTCPTCIFSGPTPDRQGQTCSGWGSESTFQEALLMVFTYTEFENRCSWGGFERMTGLMMRTRTRGIRKKGRRPREEIQNLRIENWKGLSDALPSFPMSAAEEFSGLPYPRSEAQHEKEIIFSEG